MNAKHYVSLEVAKLLKEKGYNEECYLYYKEEDPALYYRELYNRNSERDDIISAPTLLEAMDWLEERGIRIVTRLRIHVLDDKEVNYWYYEVFTTKHTNAILEFGVSDGVVMHTDRNECMNAAIKKGVELL